MSRYANSLVTPTVLVVLIFGGVSFSVPNDYDPERALPNAGYKQGEVIVRFAPKATGAQPTLSERNGILGSLGGGEVEDTCRLVAGLTLVKLPESLSVQNAITVFKNVESILYAQPNYILKALSTFPNDPNFDQLWGMHNTGQTGGTPDANIDAPEAWDIETGSSDIVIAVLDSGVDLEHEDLEDNMWINEAEYNGDPNVDDDNNGYEDDVYDYDFACKYGANVI